MFAPLCYNKYVIKRGTQPNGSRKNFKKNFEKTLDKLHRLCYNKGTEKGKRVQKTPKKV